MKNNASATTELRREFSPDLCRTICAFANSEGGTLLLGVAPDGTVFGVHDAGDLLMRVASSISDSIRPNVGAFVDYQTEMIEGRASVSIVVQRGTSPPYFLADKGMKPEGVFLRRGSSTVPASEMEIARMIRETDGESFENARCIEQDLTFSQAEREFESRGIAFSVAARRALKFTTTDGIYTNLALLFSDRCPRTIKIAVFEGSTKAVFRERRETSGSILQQMNEVWEYINRFNPIRTRGRDYPVEAVSEALLNALVHRDYAATGSTIIAIFQDRMELVSMGGPPEGANMDDLLLGIPAPRNEALASVFAQLGITVAFGTGLQKILACYEGTGKKPRIEATKFAFKVVLPNVNHQEEESRLTENEHTVMALFANTSTISRRDAEAALSLSQAMAVRVLRGLVAKGEIVPVGKGKNTRYIQAPRA